MAKVIDFDTWNVPINEVLSLNGRIVNCFLHANIHTIEQLIDRTEVDLLNIPQLGQSSLDTVKRELAQHQLMLKGAKIPTDGLVYHPREPMLVIYEKAFAEGRKVGFAEGVEVCQDSIERALSIVAATEKEVKLINLIPVNDRRVEELDVSPRTLNNIKRDGITTIGQLAEYSQERLMRIQGFGETCLREVIQALLGYDLTLKEDAPKMQPNFQGYNPSEEQK
jgi:DNA-directed RNA polymerase alpha subunit